MIENLIIGAGLSGLFVANFLKGKSLILEKSKGVGGRIATRRIENLGFDHGASSLSMPTEISDVFTNLIQKKSPDLELLDHHPLWVRGGMTQIPKSLALGLDILRNQKVISLKKEKFHWICITEDQSFKAKRVILTAPLPQSLDLLRQSSLSFPHELSSHRFSRTVLSLFILKQEMFFPPIEKTSFFQSIKSMKHRGLHPLGYVAEVSSDYSDKLFDDPTLESIAREELSKILLNNPGQISHHEIKRWRYSKSLDVIDQDFLQIQPELFIIGDSFRYPDTRGSLLSAFHLQKFLS